MNPTRRDFVLTAGATAVALAARPIFAADPPARKPRLRKAVKYDMVTVPSTDRDKLEAVKKAGFVGVEINSPSGLHLAKLVEARDATGVAIHGVIDSAHWKDTLSHPDEAVRAKGLAALTGALADAKRVGADTVLLVPGVVNKDVTYRQCWDRSTEEVKKAIPDAEKLGVRIAIEVVWNNFLTKPEQLVEYVDQFKTPAVGAYFDVSNMVKYGVPPSAWVRALGKRMLKFDFKGFSQTKFDAKQNPWVPIGEGTEDWPEVVKALGEIGYDGWATAEVNGGDAKWLADVSARMDKVLEL